MTGQLDLFGAERAEAEERPTVGKGRASARPEPAPAPRDPKALATIFGGEPPAETVNLLARVATVASVADVDGPPLSLTQALAAIAELIREPERWSKGCSARDRKGEPTIPGAPGAVTLSAYGAFALLRTSGRIPDAVALRLWLALDGATPNGARFARWHDAPFTTHAEVLALIEALKNRSAEP